MPTVDLIALLLAAVLGGGGVGALIQKWRLSGVEGEAIAIKTLRAVIGELRDELDRKDLELNNLRVRVEAAQRQLERAFDDPPPELA